MSDFKSIFALIQVPIILFLVFFCYVIYKQHKIKPFRLIGIGWTLNCIYAFLEAIESRDPGLFQSKHYLYNYIAFLFDLIAGYFILIGCRNFYKSPHYINKIIPRSKTYLSLLFISSFILLISPYNPPLPWTSNNIAHLLYSYTLFIAYFCFFNYAIAIRKKYKVGSALIYGSAFYCIIQAIPGVFHIANHSMDFLDEYVKPAAFAVGIIAKTLITFGLYKLHVNLIQRLSGDEEFNQRLQMNIGRALHELQKPGEGIKESVTNLLRNNEKYRIISPTRYEIKNIEEYIEHINVIIAAARKMIYEPEILNFAVIKNKKEYKFTNINIILKTATNIISNTLKKSGKEYTITIQESFAAETVIYCNFSDILQISLNLLKNSCEAITIDKSKSKGAIFISTIKDNINHIATIQIDDNGCGVNDGIKDLIFVEGFSTKPANVAIKGYGLTIVREIIDFYKGTIEIKSPYEKSRLRSFGTSIIVKLPYNFTTIN